MRILARHLTAATLAACALAVPAGAASLDVRVRSPRGAGVRDAVVWAVPEGRPVPASTASAVMDQKDRMFVPHVLAVQTGTAVRFPNSDNVRHHVYSFSPAKTFQLPLYKGTPPNPIVFDKAGIVTIGCNIHDRMSAFIIVVDTPHFAKTSADGRAKIAGLQAGRYVLRMWYPDMREEPQVRRIELTGSEARDVVFVAARGASAPPPGP